MINMYVHHAPDRSKEMKDTVWGYVVVIPEVDSRDRFVRHNDPKAWLTTP